MRTKNYGSLFKRVEKIQCSLDENVKERKTVYVEHPNRAECIKREFRL